MHVNLTDRFLAGDCSNEQSWYSRSCSAAIWTSGQEDRISCSKRGSESTDHADSFTQDERQVGYLSSCIHPRGHPLMTSTRKSGFWPLPSSTCKYTSLSQNSWYNDLLDLKLKFDLNLLQTVLLIYVDEKFPLFIPSNDEILVQKTVVW